MRIVFVGPPGAGKGTQAQRLKDHLGVVHLSTGEILRDAHRAGTELGLKAAEYFQQGLLVPDEVARDIVLERLALPDCASGCLFDGFPRTVAQAEVLDNVLARQGMPLDLVIALQIPDDDVFQRLALRGRPDDNHDTVLERLRVYRRQTEPLLDYYRRQGILRTVDGHGTEEEVFDRIRKVVSAS